jgi:hypothetical protein
MSCSSRQSWGFATPVALRQEDEHGVSCKLIDRSALPLHLFFHDHQDLPVDRDVESGPRGLGSGVQAKARELSGPCCRLEAACVLPEGGLHLGDEIVSEMGFNRRASE